MLSEDAAIVLGLGRAEAALRRRVEAGLPLGLTGIALLRELDAVVGGRLRAADLAQRLQLSPSGVTRAMEPLIALGLVERAIHDRDARARYLGITPAGRIALEGALAALDAAAAVALRAVTRSDRIALLGLFERLTY